MEFSAFYGLSSHQSVIFVNESFYVCVCLCVQIVCFNLGFFEREVESPYMYRKPRTFAGKWREKKYKNIVSDKHKDTCSRNTKFGHTLKHYDPLYSKANNDNTITHINP